MTKTAAPQALVTPAARFASALVVVATVAFAWTGAEAASHEAVNGMSAQLSATQLPTVVVTGKRDMKLASAEAARAAL